jgi:hypothetical protein
MSVVRVSADFAPCIVNGKLLRASCVAILFLAFSRLLLPCLFASTAYSTDLAAGKTVQAIINSWPGLMAVAGVDIASGMALASHSNVPSLNPETVAAYNTEVVKQKLKAMSALKLTDGKMEDILLTLSNQMRLIKLTDDGQKFICLVASTRDTNLTLARDVVQGASLPVPEPIG